MVSMAKGWGGAEEYLEILRDRLIKMGISCSIIVRKGGAYSKRLDQKRDITEETVKRSGDVIQIPSGIRGVLRLNKGFIAKDPKERHAYIIHVNRYYDILRGWLLKKMMPGSILILYQNCYLNHPHWLPLYLTDGIICISKFVKTSITKRFPSSGGKIKVINPGIDLGLFDTVKGDYNIGEKVKIGTVGRFDKNQEELLMAIAGLKKMGICAQVHLAGEGMPEDKKRLKDLSERIGIGEDVIFRGNLPHHSMPGFYLDMDICASAMMREGLSLFAMEAMACGIPFVAYYAPGFNELIDNVENGMLVKGGVREFALCLLYLVKSLDTRKSLGINAVKKAREYFGIDRNVREYLDFIDSISL
ncbi:glycosyltransferase family 4 protein [bacterium]|nr:glycosyltransferase family 4 protein [bacterium]